MLYVYYSITIDTRLRHAGSNTHSYQFTILVLQVRMMKQGFPLIVKGFMILQWNPFREATLMRGHPLWKGHLTMLF